MEQQEKSLTWQRKVELLFENFLWQTRWLVLIAVLASLLSSFVIFMVGLYEVFHLVFAFLGELSYKNFYAKLLSVVIASVDLFLIGTFLLVFSLGLYELFISKIDPAENDPLGQRVLVIKSLEDLKEILSKGILGAVILVDATNPNSVKEALHLAENIRKHYDIPIVFAVTKTDKEGAKSLEEIKLELEDIPKSEVVKLNPNNKEEGKEVLLKLLSMLL